MKKLEGKKTYIGLVVALIGVLNLTKYISPEEAEHAMKLIFELIGIAIAVYGRAVAKPKAK